MTNERLSYLLTQYISGKSIPEEEDELFKLIQDPEEEVYIRNWLGNYIGEPKELIPLADNAAAAMLRSVMQQKMMRLPSTRKRNRWMVAAAIIMMSAAALFSYFIYNRPADARLSTVDLKDDVLPGKNGAILTFSDGKQVILDSLSNGVISSENNLQVRLKDGRLVYEGTNTSSPQEVEYNMLSTPKGRQFQIQLPDGTKVWLNAASSIRYPTVFNEDVRKVSIKGEVYFEVAKIKNKPFIVEVNDLPAIEVLGTHFNINAYEDEKDIRTTLLEGKVKVNHHNHMAMLEPGQQARFLHAETSENTKITVMNDANISQVMAWKNGVFDFNHASLNELMRQLARWYDIEVIFEEGIPEMEFRGKMRRDVSLSKVLFFLEGSDVHFRLEKGLKRLVVVK